MKNKKIFALLLCAVFAVTVSVLASGCSQEKDSPPPSGQSAQNAGGGDTGTDCVATALRQGAGQFEILFRRNAGRRHLYPG